MSSPVAPGGVDLGDLYTSIAEENAPASMDPAPTVTEDAPPDDGAATLSEPEALAESTAEESADPAQASASDAVPPNSQSQAQQTLPEGGQPFAFSVDGGRKFSPDGAVQFPDGSVLLPERAWAQIRGGFLVDRESVNSKLAAARHEVQQAQQAAQRQVEEQVGAVALERDQARAALEEFQRILAGGPDAVLQWAENFAVNRPALEASMKARALEVQLEAERRQVKQFQAQRDQQTEEQRAEELRPQLEAHFDRALDHYLAGPYAGVATTAQERADLRQFLWDTHRTQLFYEDDQGIGFRKEILEAVLGREKMRVEAVAKQTATLGAAAQRNAAALAPSPTMARPTVKAAAPAKRPPAPIDPEAEIGRRDYLND